jgi:hypothetical protein
MKFVHQIFSPIENAMTAVNFSTMASLAEQRQGRKSVVQHAQNSFKKKFEYPIFAVGIDNKIMW